MSESAAVLSVKQYLGRSLRLLLKPLVKLFIDQGIAYGEFCDAVRESYVEMALRNESEPDGKSLTRIAIATGLTRKEVASVLEEALKGQPHELTFAHPGRLLHEWHSDPSYTGPYGIPSELPFKSDGFDSKQPSFEELVETYTPGQDPSVMLHELLRVGAIAETDKEQYKVLRRDFEAEGLSPQLIERLGDVSFNINKTLTYNVQKKKVGEGIFDRRVLSNNKLDQAELDLYSSWLKNRGQTFLEEVDNYLSSNVAKKNDNNRDDLFDAGLVQIQYIVKDPEQKKTLREFLIEHGLEDMPFSERSGENN